LIVVREMRVFEDGC